MNSLEQARKLIQQSFSLTGEDKQAMLANLGQLDEAELVKLAKELQALARQEQQDLKSLSPEATQNLDETIRSIHRQAFRQAEGEERQGDATKREELEAEIAAL